MNFSFLFLQKFVIVRLRKISYMIKILKIQAKNDIFFINVSPRSYNSVIHACHYLILVSIKYNNYIRKNK